MNVLGALVSFFLPGLGQLLQGRIVVGGLYGIVWLLGVALWGIGGPDTLFYVFFGEMRVFPIGDDVKSTMTGPTMAIALIWSWGIAVLAARDAWSYRPADEARSVRRSGAIRPPRRRS